MELMQVYVEQNLLSAASTSSVESVTFDTTTFSNYHQYGVALSLNEK